MSPEIPESYKQPSCNLCFDLNKEVNKYINE